MKHRVGLVLGLLLGVLAAHSLQAEPLFRLFWRGAYYTKDSTGHIIAVGLSEQDLVNQVAQNTGNDPSQLILVYRPNERDAAVIQNNGAFVATVFQMQTTYTDVDNPNGTVTVRHALLTDGSHSNPLGSFFGIEVRSLTSGGALANDSLVGTALYSIPEQNTVYSARVSTGARVGQ